MKPLARPLFICSSIEKCQEKANCCAHKTPHIKDERCVPRECRYALGAGNIDCDPYDPENPRAPVPVPIPPVKTVEQVLREKQKITVTVDEATPELLAALEKKGDAIKHDDSLIPDLVAETVTKEIDIKEAVKAAAQRPVTTMKPVQKKGGRKKA